MSDCMHFPDTVEEFMEQYKMTDTKQVYSNGIEYVPIFRMKQWFEHEKAQLLMQGTTKDATSDTIQSEPHEGHWIEGKIYRDVIECNCSECGQLMTTAATVRMNYCPNCGAKMTISTK